MPAADRRPTALPAPFAALALLVAVVLLLPLPGSLSVVVARWAAEAPARLPAVDVVSPAALALLAAGVVVSALHAWRTRPGSLPGVIGAAVGVALAYGASEGLKLVLAQPRPCSRWDGVPHCPPAGDWSLPSNHATVAFAAVVVVAVAARRVWVTWAALGTALVAAAGRVLEGVHYPHDVAGGRGGRHRRGAGAAWVAVAVHRRIRERGAQA